MKGNWFIPLLVIVGVVGVLIYFNYQRGKDASPLSELFKDESAQQQKIEYEFVTNNETPAVTPQAAVPAIKQEAPALAASTQSAVASSAVAVHEKIPTGTKVFTIQIASYKDKAPADRALSKIKAKFAQAYVAQKDLGDKGTWYRLYVGQFDKKADADALLANVKTDYPQSFIITVGK